MCISRGCEAGGPLSRRTRRKGQSGVTLVELIVFIVIVSVALAGILMVFTLTTAHSGDPLPRKQALAVAEALLEEIELKDFTPGGYSGTDRSQFDDVGDYNGYSTSGVVGIDGAANPDLAHYNVAVTVQANQNLGPVGSVVANATLITVTVTDPSGQALALSGYRTDYAP